MWRVTGPHMCGPAGWRMRQPEQPYKSHGETPPMPADEPADQHRCQASIVRVRQAPSARNTTIQASSTMKAVPPAIETVAP
jgi:hypothetical protein